MVDVLMKRVMSWSSASLVAGAVAMSLPAEVIEQPNTDAKLPAERFAL
jgi:hypothetical protein